MKTLITDLLTLLPGAVPLLVLLFQPQSVGGGFGVPLSYPSHDAYSYSSQYRAVSILTTTIKAQA